MSKTGQILSSDTLEELIIRESYRALLCTPFYSDFFFKFCHTDNSSFLISKFSKKTPLLIFRVILIGLKNQ